MSTLTLRPNGDSSVAQDVLTPETPTTHYTKVDETTKDETDSVAVNGGAASQSLTDIYSFPDHTTESGTINSVTIKCYANYRQAGADTTTVYINPCIKIGSTVYGSGNQELSTTVTLFSGVFSKRPSDNADWLWSDIDALLAGDTMTSHCTEPVKNCRSSFCYQLWVEVDYTEGGGASNTPIVAYYLKMLYGAASRCLSLFREKLSFRHLREQYGF